MAEKRSTGKSNKRQIVLLGVLGAALIYFLLHSFVFTDSKPQRATPPRTPASGSKPGGTIVRTDRQVESSSAASNGQALVPEQAPLNFALVSTAGGGSSTPGDRGNIFDYYKEPPKPLPPPPPPPPITVTYVQPSSAVASTPRTFTLKVVGKAIPPDAQIVINSRPRATKRVDESTLTTEIVPNDYPSQMTMTVEVKSQTDPKMVSNVMTFVVQPAPEPTFKYIGRIGDVAVIDFGGRDTQRLTKGNTVQNIWRIEAIRDDAVEVIHTQLEIKKRVPIQPTGR